MTTTHTPGPWPWEYTGDGKRIVVGDGLVCGPRGYEVAEVYSDDCPPEEAEANARLIAAAPELLEALELLCEIVDDQLDGEFPEAQGAAQRAIAKARGQ